MKYLRILIISLIGLSVFSCSKVPITGRKQLKLIPYNTMMEMGQTNYATFLKENPAINPPTRSSAEVSAVGVRISKAVEKYLRDNKLGNKVDGYKWEFNVVDSPEANAWCMPGGKVVVYTGLLPITQNETALAVVMGHEIAHAIAQHGNERMSQGLLLQLGGVALDVATSTKPDETRQLFQLAYGVGANVGVMLPYSRKHESEADRMGLVFMAMAGYDPNQAPVFWERMSKLEGSKPPLILSTHPSDEKRIVDLKKNMPEAMKYYKPSGN